MRTLIINTSTLVWLVLMTATVMSWWLGTQEGMATGSQALQQATVALMVISFFKVRLVIMHFMDVRDAPWALRLILEGWVFGVCALVLGLYLWAGA